MEEEVEQPSEIQIEEAQPGELELQHHQVLVPISGGQETVIIATSENGQETMQTVQVPTTVTIDQLAQAGHHSYIQVPATATEQHSYIQVPTGSTEGQSYIQVPATSAEGQSYIQVPTTSAEGQSYIQVPSTSAEGQSYIQVPTGSTEGQSYIQVPTTSAEGQSYIQVPSTSTEGQSYIQVPTTSTDGEENTIHHVQHVQIQEAELQHGEAIQTVQIEPGETIQTVHFDPNGETTVHIQGTDATIPVHIQPAETLQPVQIQSVHMGLTSATADHVVVPATETLQQVVHISNQPAITVQTETMTATETINTTETVNSLVPTSYPTEPVMTGWEDLFIESYTPYEGYVYCLEDVSKLITAYEISTITKFVKTRCSGKLFGVVRFDKKCRIWWEDIRDTNGVELKYDGTPFVIMGSRALTCLFGPDNNKNSKIRAQEERVRLSLTGIEDTKKRRQMKAPSKKKGCPASISIRHVVRFPRHAIDFDDVVKRRQAAITLKEDFADGVRLPYEERFYVHLPDPAIHQSHPEGEEALAQDSLDERIVAKIHELVAEGMEKPNDILEQLNTFVTDELFKGSTPPPLSWRRFYPRKNDVRNQVYRAKGIKSKPKDKDEVAMAIQAVGGIEDGGVAGGGDGGTILNVAALPAASPTASPAALPEPINKPQLNRLRYQCRDKLKLLIDVTHICNSAVTLQAMLGILNTLHTEVWNDVLERRGDGPLPKLEEAHGSTPNGTGEAPQPSLLWGTTGLLNRPMKKRGRKRKEDTVEDSTDPYAKSFITKSRDSRSLADRYKANESRKRVKQEPGEKRGRGRPRKNPLPVVGGSNTTVSQPGDEMEIVTVDISSCTEIGPIDIPCTEIEPDGNVEHMPIEQIDPEGNVEQIPIEQIDPEGNAEHLPMEQIGHEGNVEHIPIDQIVQVQEEEIS